jgi:hypothetical protein
MQRRVKHASATIDVLLETMFSIRSVQRGYKEQSSGLIFQNFSSERMLHKDYYCRSSVEKKISGRGSQGAWRQDELIGGKPPVVR